MFVNALSLLSTPFFQTEWNGVSLCELAGELGIPLERLAGPEFYAAFYRKLEGRRFEMPASWLASKARTSGRIRALFSQIDPLWREQNRVALAAGVGLGVVEIPLIADGYRVHLHECQHASLKYFDTHSQVAAEKIYIAPTLTPVLANSYDMVYFCQVLYALDLQIYAGALADAFRILRPGGTLAIWEPECPFKALRHRNAVHPGVFWGWQRSRWLHLMLAKQAGFKVCRIGALTSADQPVDPNARRALGCILAENQSVNQELIFAKPG